MKRIRDLLLLGVISSVFTAHSYADCMKSRTDEVRNLLNRDLKAGDTRARAKKILKTAGIAYEYDRFQNRYQSTITDARCGPYDAISIYVNFNSSGKMSNVEVLESYTAP